MSLKPGDVVRLKSGGPKMTVEDVGPGPAVACTWYNGTGDGRVHSGRFEHASFNESTLDFAGEILKAKESPPMCEGQNASAPVGPQPPDKKVAHETLPDKAVDAMDSSMRAFVDATDSSMRAFVDALCGTKGQNDGIFLLRI